MRYCSKTLVQGLLGVTRLGFAYKDVGAVAAAGDGGRAEDTRGPWGAGAARHAALLHPQRLHNTYCQSIEVIITLYNRIEISF